MQASSSFKKAFLRRMLMGLRLGGVSSRRMSFQERKRAIKLSADVAMASASGGKNWSRALIAGLRSQEMSTAPVRSTLGNGGSDQRLTRSGKILRRSLRACSRVRKGPCRRRAAAVLARSMVKKRTQVLKSLIPGGESLDAFTLLDEALDYAISLRAQVDLMRRLVRAIEDSNLKYISS